MGTNRDPSTIPSSPAFLRSDLAWGPFEPFRQLEPIPRLHPFQLVTSNMLGRFPTFPTL